MAERPGTLRAWLCGAHVVRLDQWCPIVSSYTAPENINVIGSTVLTGRCYGHPKGRHYDGKAINTSPLIDVFGRYARTRSGTVYRLGRPDQKWLAWCRTSGHRYDPKRPIRIREMDDA